MDPHDLERAEAALHEGRIDAAISALEGLASASFRAAVLLHVARWYAGEGDAVLDAAERTWAREDGGDLEARLRLGLFLARRRGAYLAWVQPTVEQIGTPAARSAWLARSSHVSRSAGALQRSFDEAREALRLAEQVGDPAALAYALESLGSAEVYRSDYAGSEPHLREAVALYQRVGDRLGALEAEHTLALMLLSSGRPAEALRRVRRIVEGYRAAGAATMEPRALLHVGEALRLLDEPLQAVEAYRRAIEAGTRVGSSHVPIARGTLAVALVEAGLWEEARLTASQAIDESERSGRRLPADLFCSALLPLDARDGDGPAFDAHLERVERAVATTGYIELDSASLARRAAEIWASGDDADALARAARAHDLTLRAWRAENLADEVERERAALAELGRRGAPVPLGPYRLDRVLGRGAMGEVWRARHVGTGEAVALKVLTAEAARRPVQLDLVERELGAVASLDHPLVVALLDHGRVSETADVMTGARLAAESPYLVLELVDGTTLESCCGQLAWPEVREVLRQLLDALAHAHARGVIHLDVKPANVLIDAHGRVKLTDFGVAAALLEPYGPRAWSGTPSYMAPEQVQRRWRDHGPWTDLYALGGLAWDLLTGAPPFPTDDPQAAMAAQLNEALPPFQPVVAVPHELGGWLARLLTKRPRHRFRRAADAAWALARLEGATVGPVQPGREADRAPSTTDRGASPTIVLPDDDFEISPPPSHATTGAPRSAPPPLPPAWRLRASRSPGASGAGLPLLSLRTRPLVGRERERDLLWGLLREAEGGRGGAVVVCGPPGHGRTALVQWLAERAHEVGAATVLRTLPTDRSPLADLLARPLGVEGLDLAAAAERTAEMLDDLGASDDSRAEQLAAAAIGWSSLDDRTEATCWLVERLAAHRVVLAVLDDATDDPDTLGLARALAALPARVLVVLTARAGVPAELPGAVTLDLEPLDARRALVDSWLPLRADLAEQVAEATAGVPLLAELAMTTLVEGDQLVRGDALELRQGLALDVPRDLATGWRHRVEALLRGLSDSDRAALEAAAGLGPSFTRDDWRLASPAPPSRALVLRLLDRRLAHARGDRLALAHQGLREHLASRG